MAGDVDVDIDINVENNTSYEINEITNNVVHLHQAVQREEKQNNRWSESIKKVAKSALSGARAVGRIAASVAAVAAATGPAVAGLFGIGKALAVLGKAGARLTPLLALLPALAAGFGLVKATLKLAAPGLGRAFEPITRQFRDADGNATKLAKTLERVVGIDVRPAAQGFVKLNMPAIAHAMERIAYQTNLIVAGTLKWANSLRGVESIKAISKGTADLFTRLTPHIIATVSAFGDLAGRAADPAFKRLGDVIIRILDGLRKWANDTSLEDINGALDDLSGYGKKLGSTWSAIRDIGKWLADHEGAIKHFSDVAAGAAIALGIATGNIPAIVGGAVSLIINHWQQLKGPFTDAIGWVKNLADAWRRDSGRIKIAEGIMNALDAGRRAFMDMISNIGPQWTRFIQTVKKAWDEWAPIIAAWWNSGGRVIFASVGTAIGAIVIALLNMSTAAVAATVLVAQAFKGMVRSALDALGLLIGGAAKALGWIPGIGPQLSLAAQAFAIFRDKVNAALDGIDSIKTIRVNASVYVTGGGSVAGGVDQRTGNSRNAGLAAATGWQRVAEAFAADRGGRRTGGPTPVIANVTNTINLDGKPFRAYTDRTVAQSESRAAWRSKVGAR